MIYFLNILLLCVVTISQTSYAAVYDRKPLQMDGAIRVLATRQTKTFELPAVFNKKELREDISPFYCKLWTDYRGERGLGAHIFSFSMYGLVQYPGGNFDTQMQIPLAKDAYIVFSNGGYLKEEYMRDGIEISFEVSNENCSYKDPVCTPTVDKHLFMQCFKGSPPSTATTAPIKR